MKVSMRMDDKRIRSAIGAQIKAEGNLASKKIALAVIAEATANLVRSRGTDRTGLSRKTGGGGEYAHSASGKTVRSFRTYPKAGGWHVTLGGAAHSLQWGQGAHTVPISRLRAWAAIKFPGLEGEELQRFIRNLQQRIKRNGLRPTKFFSRAMATVRADLRNYKTARRLPSEARLQAEINRLRAIAETRALPRVRRRSK
jgi:hypothetical protein